MPEIGSVDMISKHIEYYRFLVITDNFGTEDELYGEYRKAAYHSNQGNCFIADSIQIQLYICFNMSFRVRLNTKEQCTICKSNRH